MGKEESVYSIGKEESVYTMGKEESVNSSAIRLALSSEPLMRVNYWFSTVTFAVQHLCLYPEAADSRLMKVTNSK